MVVYTYEAIHPSLGRISIFHVERLFCFAGKAQLENGTAVNAYASGLYHIYSKNRWKERLVPPGRRQLYRQRLNFLALIPYFAYSYIALVA